MKKNKISKNWINKQRRDIYVRKSKIDGYRSRAVYKLIEIDEKFKIFKNGISVVDLGASPGSWSQYSAKKIKNGNILSIDLKPMEKIENIKQIIGNFLEPKVQQKILEYFGVQHINEGKVDVVISDMAENTTGNKNLDSISSGELCKEALIFASHVLKKNSHFVSKIFMGSSFNEIISTARFYFKETKVFKPLASRKDSKESFIICKNLR